MEINESRIPVAKGKGIPGDEKREREKTRFKTEANSASPNSNSRKKSSTSSWEIEKETMLHKGVQDTTPNEERQRTLFLEKYSLKLISFLDQLPNCLPIDLLARLQVNRFPHSCISFL